MSVDDWLQQVASKRIDSLICAFFIALHHGRIARDIGYQYRGTATLKLLVIRTQNCL